MKQKSLPFYFFVCLLLVVPSMYGQQIPELVFRNPVLISGTALKDGARYRFPNAAPNIDAVVEIKKRSASNVVIRNIDLTSFGWDKAFQPELGIPGTVPPNHLWWVEFEISFLKAGTNRSQKVEKFDVTSLDVDGDSWSIQEFVQFQKAKSVTYSTVTNLTASTVINDAEDEGDEDEDEGDEDEGDEDEDNEDEDDEDNDNGGEQDYNVQGPVLTFLNIDTLGTAVMATYHYENKDRIRIKIGGRSGSRSSTAGMRLNSLWYRSFNLSSMGILPVKLNDFTAKYSNQNVVLTWTTEQERTFSHFIVEKSLNGTDFKEAAVILTKDDGAINKSYSFTDDLKTDKGTFYYRLKMIDASLEVRNSPVRIIKLNDAMAGVNIQVYPNPVINELRITVPSAWQNAPVTYDVYSASGKMLKHLVSNSANQTEVLRMNSLNAGLYIVKVSSGKETAVKQIMKSN